MRDVRLGALHQEIVRQGSLGVDTAAAAFDVSKETIRRDLDRLAGIGLVVRTRGGAVAPGASLTELDVDVRSQEQRQEKRTIARAVLKQLVVDGISLALDTGSTILEIARGLRAHRVTAVTNSLSAINVLAGSECNVVVLGGSLRSRSMSTVGSSTEAQAGNFHCDLALISAPAMTPGAGLMDTDLEAVAIKRLFIRHSRRAFAVMDHTKFGKTAFTTICATNELCGVVTDDGVSDLTVEKLRADGLEVIVAARRST